MSWSRCQNFAPKLLAGALMLLLSLLTVGTAASQSGGTVTGAVVDAASRLPLNGAQVSIEGTGRAVLTDARGRFVITGVPAGPRTVRVSNLGYRTATEQVSVASGQTAQINVAMEVSAVTLDEVVVTGTAGAVERRRLGASMGTVNMNRLQEVTPVASMGQALESRMPGVRSVAAAGGVGAARDLRIRGTSSFLMGQRPVVYIDGVRVDNSAGEWAGATVNGGTCCAFSGGAGEDRLSDLNPEDIERVEVLKGAAAATLYGSEASNGVIQIFTKRGRNNSRPNFTFSSTAGFNRYRENWTTKLYPNFTGPTGFRARDANELIENGLIHNYDMTVQGGGEDVTYFVSGGLGFEEGSLKPNEQKSATLRTNLRWQASDRWSFDLNSSFARNNILALQSGNNWTALYGNAILGNPLVASEKRPFGEPWTSVEDIRAIHAFSNATRWTGGFTTTFQPSERFSQRVTLGFDHVSDQKERLLPFGSEYVYLGKVGERNVGYRTGTTATLDYLGTFSFKLPGAIGSDFSFGSQGYWSTDELSMAIGRGFAGPGVTVVGGAATTLADEYFEEEITIGAFAQNRFSIQDKLFATVGLRVDGNSAFGVNYGFQPYPKADLAYLMGDESFMPDFISNLKLRAAVGTSGLAPGAFDQFTTFAATAVLETNVPGVTPANPGNADLEPEKTTEIEGGFDLGLFDDKIGIEFTAYRATTRDALLRVALPPSQGFVDAQLRNTGEIRNIGWELSLNTSPIVTDRFRWNTQVNLDGNDNEIISLGPTAVEGRLGSHRQGKPVNSLWGYVITGYNPTTNRHTRSDTAVYFGSPLPTFNASMGNTITFGDFRLHALVSTERGAWFNNGDRPYRIRQGASDEFLATLDANAKRTARTDSLVNYFTLISPIDKRDNVRLRDVSLSYSFPESLASGIGLGRTTMTLSGQNLMWWDDCNCADPNMQYAPGSSNNFSGFLAMPTPRRFLLSVRTSF